MEADKRTELLDHALALFARRGYDAVGVQEIVEAAGVTKPTLYHYFQSKRGLLETLLRERTRDLLPLVRDKCLYQHDLVMNLRGVADALLLAGRTQPDLFRLLLTLQFAPSDNEGHQVAAEVHGALFQLVEDLFRAAEQDHGNMRGRSRAYALTFLGMVNSYIALSLEDPDALPTEGSHRAVHQFMHGIFS